MVNSRQQDTNALLQPLEGWALILGVSSGFGAAAARTFARAGLNVAGVHLDRRATMGHVKSLEADLGSTGVAFRLFNVNAADARRRVEVLDELQSVTASSGGLRVLMHSLAFGTLKPYWAEGDATARISQANMDMTLDVMAHSLLYWTQDAMAREMFSSPARIFAMTSEGSRTAWPAYGAVGAAKAALESHVRQLAVELAPHGITANAISAGVTDTPALRKIPGHEKMIADGIARHPYGRLTTPDDVAATLLALTTPACNWVSGNVLGVDGAERVSG